MKKLSKKSDIISHWTQQTHDPFSLLGPIYKADRVRIRVFSPHTNQLRLLNNNADFVRLEDTDYFEWEGKAVDVPKHYRVEAQFNSGAKLSYIDPYSFDPIISDFDLHLFSEGNLWCSYDVFGANLQEIDQIRGILFSVWAPNAKRVSVIGNFNSWDGRRHLMRSRGGSGVWELFIPELATGELYKFELLDPHGHIIQKNDPYAKQFEVRPKTAAIVTVPSEFQWSDESWQNDKKLNNWLHTPMSVYEAHLGSWKRDEHHAFINYKTLAHELVRYVKELGYTHIELLPISEHPLDASWGYQTLGYFAPTSRFGSPDEFRYFVNYCHENNIGVILDWVPAHFPKDSHGLGRFDGSALYEHEDPKKGEHRDWGTFIFNYGRNEVSNFLISNALYWLSEFHIDGLRVDAVASMLYLDYSREHDDWIPNQYGGNENLEAINFIRKLNEQTQSQYPGTLVIAEESTSWPSVSRPTWLGGLGFSMKWNMGWMHDTLNYFNKDPIYRRFHHENLTFGLLYAFSENFTLPFSHDEVVHGKGSMINKMPGDHWQKFANLRLLYTYMFCYPGKKLLFMGGEFAQYNEWNEADSLSWHLTEEPAHQGIMTLVKDLNGLYKNSRALYFFDFDAKGFEWIDCHDNDQSIISFIRRYQDEHYIIILNFTPVPRDNYRLGVPVQGNYREIFNSDSEYYGGSNMGNGHISVENTPWMGRPYSIALRLPPLGGLILALE